jgi:hypothetical protein
MLPCRVVFCMLHTPFTSFVFNSFTRALCICMFVTYAVFSRQRIAHKARGRDVQARHENGKAELRGSSPLPPGRGREPPAGGRPAVALRRARPGFRLARRLAAGNQLGLQSDLSSQRSESRLRVKSRKEMKETHDKMLLLTSLEWPKWRM